MSKLTMTLNLSPREMAVVEELAAEMDLSKTAILRSAIRLLQLTHMKAKAGHYMMFSGEPLMSLAVLMPGFGEPAALTDGAGNEKT